MNQLKCPRCRKPANRQHFIEDQQCKEAAARIGGMAAGLMRTKASGGRQGGRRATYRHRDEMAESRGESSLKLPFNTSITKLFGFNRHDVNVGQLRNGVLDALGLKTMAVRGSTKLSDRFRSDRIQLDFRRADVVALWKRFRLRDDCEDSLGTLSQAIEKFISDKDRGWDRG